MFQYTRSVVWLAVPVLGALSLWVASWPAPPSWADWPGDGCRAALCYCEAHQPGWVVQPLVTTSNWVFVVVGLVVLVGGRHRALGLASVGVGVASWVYHASLSLAGEWLDVVGMYALVGVLVYYNATRYWPHQVAWWRLAYGVGMSLTGAQMAWAREWQGVVLAGLVLSALVLEAGLARRGARPAYGWLGAGLALFALGGAVWLLETRLPCDPASVWQWHAVWHICAAGAIAALARFYASMQPST